MPSPLLPAVLPPLGVLALVALVAAGCARRAVLSPADAVRGDDPWEACVWPPEPFAVPLAVTGFGSARPFPSEELIPTFTARTANGAALEVLAPWCAAGAVGVAVGDTVVPLLTWDAAYVLGFRSLQDCPGVTFFTDGANPRRVFRTEAVCVAPPAADRP
ncbi:MAG TPA: hypothetical protein VK610_03235 [Rhodothermales bacterium]|nr:hypothetical protein [Rhodothermales bacterium]